MIVIFSVVLLTAERRGCICGEVSFSLAEPQQDISPLCDTITWIWVKQLRQLTSILKHHPFYLKIFSPYESMILKDLLTKVRTSSSTKAITVQAVPIQKVLVRGAGEGPTGTRPIQRVEVQQHWSLVVTFKIGSACTSQKCYHIALFLKYKSSCLIIHPPLKTSPEKMVFGQPGWSVPPLA